MGLHISNMDLAPRDASPNKLRIRQLSDKLSSLQDEMDHEKQARSDATELKLKVLDDKLLRAQITEEEKLRPLNEQIERLMEELAAERLSREVMDARKDLDAKIMKQVDETAFALRLDLAREKKLREEAEERHEKEVADEIIRIADSVDQDRKNRLDG